MRIYVAGKYSQKSLVSDIMRDLRAQGHTITHDWASMEQTDRDEAAMAEYAKLDLAGAASADLVIALLLDKDYAYNGTWSEIHYALGHNRMVAIVTPYKTKAEGEPLTNNVFFWNEALHRCDSVEAALEWARVESERRDAEYTDLARRLAIIDGRGALAPIAFTTMHAEYYKLTRENAMGVPSAAVN